MVTTTNIIRSTSTAPAKQTQVKAGAGRSSYTITQKKRSPPVRCISVATSPTTTRNTWVSL